MGKFRRQNTTRPVIVRTPCARVYIVQVQYWNTARTQPEGPTGKREERSNNNNCNRTRRYLCPNKTHRISAAEHYTTRRVASDPCTHRSSISFTFIIVTVLCRPSARPGLSLSADGLAARLLRGSRKITEKQKGSKKIRKKKPGQIDIVNK